MATIFVVALGLLAQGGESTSIDPKQFNGLTLEVTRTATPTDLADIWQTGPYCGANSLYVLLKLFDRPIDHKTIRGQVPTTQKGASLLHLKQVAARHNLPCLIESVAPEDLRPAMVPFIALLGISKGGAINGHFVVVVSVNEDRIEAIDGTSGNLDRFRRSVFNKVFSGYLLRPEGLTDGPFVRNHLAPPLVTFCGLNVFVTGWFAWN